jgi:hypothetical protein
MSSQKQAGFTAKDYLAIFNKPRKTFSDVIERLQASKAEYEAPLFTLATSRGGAGLHGRQTMSGSGISLRRAMAAQAMVSV